MPFKRLFKDKYAGSSPENASVVRTLFDLFKDLRSSLSECFDALLFPFQMRLRFSIGGHVRTYVGPSVRPSKEGNKEGKKEGRQE